MPDESQSKDLGALPLRHRRALSWFAVHSGATIPWPEVLDDGTYLVTQAKGIYKPEWSQYALSVRETLISTYADRAPIHRRDGSWVYVYHQEGDPNESESRFTNRGLEACIRDEVPVGVLRQVSGKPDTQYTVLGLARVTGSGGGYFVLEGFSRNAYGLAQILSGSVPS